MRLNINRDGLNACFFPPLCGEKQVQKPTNTNSMDVRITIQATCEQTGIKQGSKLLRFCAVGLDLFFKNRQ